MMHTDTQKLHCFIPISANTVEYIHVWCGVVCLVQYVHVYCGVLSAIVYMCAVVCLVPYVLWCA